MAAVLVALPPVEGAQASHPDKAACALGRVRDFVHNPVPPASTELLTFSKRIKDDINGSQTESLGYLYQLTAIDHPACDANQHALVSDGGLATLCDFICQRLEHRPRAPTDSEFDDMLLSLMILGSLSSSPSLHTSMCLVRPCLPMLVRLLHTNTAAGQPGASKYKAVALAINAAKVLVNITYLTPRLQRVVAGHKAGEAAMAVLMNHAHEGKAGDDDAELADHEAASRVLVKHAAWLLSNLTMATGSAMRTHLATSESATQALVKLLEHTDDIVVVKASEVVCNVFRDSKDQVHMLSAGVLPALSHLLSPDVQAARTPEVAAAALNALVSLAMADASAAAAMLRDECMMEGLQATLKASTIVTTDYALSNAMVAAHNLIVVLAQAAIKHNLPTTTTSEPVTASQRLLATGMERLRSTRGADQEQAAAMMTILTGSSFMTLQQASQLVGVRLPPYNAAMFMKKAMDNSTATGAALPQGSFFDALLSHLINDELLRALSEDSPRNVVHACARLQQLAVCLGSLWECRPLFSNTSLLTCLSRLLEPHQHASVRQAALSALGCLTGFPEVCAPLKSSPALTSMLERVMAIAGSEATDTQPAHGSAAEGQKDSVVGVGGEEASHQDVDADWSACDDIGSGDRVLCMLGERALVSLYLASEGLVAQLDIQDMLQVAYNFAELSMQAAAAAALEGQASEEAAAGPAAR